MGFLSKVEHLNRREAELMAITISKIFPRDDIWIVTKNSYFDVCKNYAALEFLELQDFKIVSKFSRGKKITKDF